MTKQYTNDKAIHKWQSKWQSNTQMTKQYTNDKAIHKWQSNTQMAKQTEMAKQ